MGKRFLSANVLVGDYPFGDLDRDERLLVTLTVAGAILADKLGDKALADALEDAYVDWAKDRNDDINQRG